MHIPLTQHYQIWRGDTYGEFLFLAVYHASHPKRAKFQRSPILDVLLYLCLHPLTQNDQIRHGNECREEHVLGRQPHHCVCTNASRGLSVIAEFLVHNLYSSTIYSVFHIISCEALFTSYQYQFRLQEHNHVNAVNRKKYTPLIFFYASPYFESWSLTNSHSAWSVMLARSERPGNMSWHALRASEWFFITFDA